MFPEGVTFLTFIIGFGGYLLAKAVDKALVEPIARNYGRRGILAISSIAFRVLDQETALVSDEGGTGEDLEKRLRNRLSELTGEDWSSKSVEPLFELGDMRKYLDFRSRRPKRDTSLAIVRGS